MQTYYVMQEIPHSFNPGPYMYSNNPYAHQATTQWISHTTRKPTKKKLTPLTESQVIQTTLTLPASAPEDADPTLPSCIGHKQIFSLRTLEPDKNNRKAKQQISREFLRQSDSMVYTDDFPHARQLVQAFLEQQQKQKMKQKKAAYAKKKRIQQKELARVCLFDSLLVNQIDYEYMAFPLTKDVDLYRDDFDSDAEPEEKGEPTLHGFELAKLAFEASHAD